MTLFVDDSDRYSNLRLIAWWEQEKLRRAKIMVVGAGALGNEVLKNLALLGVGQIYVVDFDTIENSNLTRSVLFRARDCGRAKATVAAESVRDLNPDVAITPLVANVMTDVGLGLFRDMDVVIGCLDNREARLWVNRSCWKVSRPWVDGGIQEINGVVKVFVPPDSACYECAMTENDYRLINLRYSCPLLRREDLLAGKIPTAPTIASMIGGMQTQEALKLIHGLPVNAGCAMVFNGATNQFYTTRFQRREDCLSHETYDAPIALPLSSTDHTAADLFAAARAHFDSPEPLSLELDRDLVVTVDCVDCRTSQRIMKPTQAVAMSRAACPSCGQTSKPTLVHRVTAGSPLAAERLADLGIARRDLVRVSANSAEQIFEFSGDGASGCL